MILKFDRQLKLSGYQWFKIGDLCSFKLRVIITSKQLNMNSMSQYIQGYNDFFMLPEDLFLSNILENKDNGSPMN